MSYAQIIAATITEPLTWSEICRRHPEQWVTLIDIHWIDESSLEFKCAIVVGASKRRVEAMARARPQMLRFEEFGCFFTGGDKQPVYGFYVP